MYEETFNPTTEKPITIWRGIDTLKLGIGIQWNSEDAIRMLAEQQAATRLHPDTHHHEAGTQLYAVLPYGRKKYRYGLQNGQLSIFFSEEEYTDHTPNCMVELYPEAITRHSLQEVTERIGEIIESLDGTPQWNKVSELHITTDTHTPQPLAISDIYDQDHKPLWVSKARKAQAISNHDADNEIERLIHKGARLETMTYGGSQLMLRIYNKTAELSAHPPKQWEMGLWNNPYADNVTRVEFQMRREKLKTMEIEGTGTLAKALPEIWSYLTRKWFTLNENTSPWGNRDATPTDFWQTVQNAWDVTTPRIPIPRPQEHAKQRLAQAWGNLLSAAAILDMHQPDQIQEMYELWNQDHPEPWQTQVSKRQQKISLMKGKIMIRDQEAELIFAEKQAAKAQLEPPYSEPKTPAIDENRHFAQLAGGMLFTLPPAAADAAAATRPATPTPDGNTDLRKDVQRCGNHSYYA